jgi:hypothetical protein
MRGVGSIIAASLMTTNAWASDLTVEAVSDLYAEHPVGFQVTGMTQGDKMRLSIVDVDGVVVVFGQARADAAGAAVFYGMLTNNEASVEVQAQSTAGDSGSATFDIGAVPDGSTGYDDGYADGAASVTPDDGIGQSDVEAAYADGAASVTVPGGDTYCSSEDTTWDGTVCVSSVTPEDGIGPADVDAAYAEGAASVTPEDGVSQADVDAAYAEGAGSVDTDAIYYSGYDDGVASVDVPDGEYYCDADSTDWDEVAGACVSSVEESMNCFQSGYCQGAHDAWSTGLPNSIVGNATEEECMTSPNSQDMWAWFDGELAAAYPSLFLPDHFIAFNVCE